MNTYMFIYKCRASATNIYIYIYVYIYIYIYVFIYIYIYIYHILISNNIISIINVLMKCKQLNTYIMYSLWYIFCYN